MLAVDSTGSDVRASPGVLVGSMLPDARTTETWWATAVTVTRCDVFEPLSKQSGLEGGLEEEPCTILEASR
jgi:hypothetical protein